MGNGRAIALAFAREGADVAVNDYRNFDEAREVVAQIEALGQRALAVEANVAEEEPVRRMVARVHDAFGGIDILVNNDGIVTLSPVEALGVALWDEMIAVHLRGTFLVTRMVLPGMLARGSGRISNLASQIGQIGRERFAHYAAAKAGSIGFSKSLAREVGARGVLVNCIASGPIATGLVPADPAGTTTDHLGPLPLRRVGSWTT